MYILRNIRKLIAQMCEGWSRMERDLRVREVSRKQFPWSPEELPRAALRWGSSNAGADHWVESWGDGRRGVEDAHKI